MQSDPVYTVLLKLQEDVTATKEKVNSLHEALLGPHGHIGRMDDDIGRLYKRGQLETTERVRCDQELEKRLQSAAGTVQGWRETLKSNWHILLAIGVVVEVMYHVQAMARGGGH